MRFSKRIVVFEIESFNWFIAIGMGCELFEMDPTLSSHHLIHAFESSKVYINHIIELTAMNSHI